MTAGRGPAANARKRSSDRGQLSQERFSWGTKLSWGRKNNKKQNNSECVLNTVSGHRTTCLVSPMMTVYYHSHFTGSKPRLREAKPCVQGHTAGRWQSQD